MLLCLFSVRFASWVWCSASVLVFVRELSKEKKKEKKSPIYVDNLYL